MKIESILQAVPHNPHYLNRYIRLIKVWRDQKIDGYFERHHICPSSMFVEYKDGRRNEWNIIRLTARQHFIVHWLLWKAYDNREMGFAFHMMCYSKRNYSGRIFEAARKAASQLGVIRSVETRAKMSAAHQGKKFSDESKARMSEAQRKRSPEAKAAAGLKHRGKTISAEMRAKQSAALAGEKNPRAMLWEIEWEDGHREQIKSMKSWCRERGFNYSTVYARLRNGDNEVYRDGFRVLGKSLT